MDASVAMIDGRPSVEAAYRSDSDRLWRSVYAYAGDAEIASDAVAEAFAQLIRRGDEVRDLAAWAAHDRDPSGRPCGVARSPDR